MTAPSGLETAFAKLVQALKDSGDFVQNHPFYADAANRAGGMSYVTSMLIRTLEEQVIQDTEFPLFRVLDHRIREGGDNPDQRYLFARIKGGETYRVWGHLGRQRRIDFQIYAGDPYIAGGGRSVSSLQLEDITFEKDGAFEITLSPEKPASGNWLENAPDGTKLLVRQVFSDWANETPGDVHIDHVASHGALKPILTPEALAQKFERAAEDFLRTVKVWPDFTKQRYLETLPVNTLMDPWDPGALGGVSGRYMSCGHYELKDDEALIVTTYPTNANYQGIQLTDLWFSSLEYANRQTSLTADQAYRSSDGAFHFVVTGRDPGVQNWLDTCGLPRGVLLLRYDGASYKEFPKELYPRTTVIKLADLRKHLPTDVPRFSPEMRADAVGDRRKHVQMRFGY